MFSLKNAVICRCKLGFERVCTHRFCGRAKHKESRRGQVYTAFNAVMKRQPKTDEPLLGIRRHAKAEFEKSLDVICQFFDGLPRSKRHF